MESVLYAQRTNEDAHRRPAKQVTGMVKADVRF
jgi:hypothetical protein